MFHSFWNPQSLRIRRLLVVLCAASMVLTSTPAMAQIVPALQPEELISLKFSNTPLDLVLDQYSDLTGRTLIKAQGVNATITLRSKTKLTHTEALVAMESALQMYNIAFVPLGDKFLKVVQTANARTSGMEIETSLPETEFPETDLLVSQVVDLKHIEFSEAQTILDQLKNSYGKIQPLERTNSLLITDTAQNLKRMLEVLDYIDHPVTIKEDIFVREIKHSKASEIAAKLNELIQDSQSDADASRERITPPSQQNPGSPQTPPGVIRARQAAAAAAAAQRAATASSAPQGAAELAERGIIQGKVRIVADDRTGILFIISQPENFAFFDKIISVLDQAIDPQVEVRVVAMEYAEAEEVAGILNEFIGAASSDEDTPAGADGGDDSTPETTRSQALRDFVRRRAQQAQPAETQSGEATEFGRLSADTRILADPRTNSIMLMGRKSDIAALEDLIDQLDIMLGQVLIEAVILEVLLDDNLSHGVDWLQRSFIVNNEEKVGPGGGVTATQPVLGFGGGQNLSGRESFIDGGSVVRDTPLASALTYYMSLYDLNLDAVITMANSTSDARILSTPVILTADNTEAKIIVGEERPVVSTTSTTDSGTIRSSFEYRNIGINLTVTPRINPERLVVMEINQTADDVGGEVLIDGNAVPIITKREFSAQVAVNNRETIVLGGLVRSTDRDSSTKVPILGDIPILGALFRSQSSAEQRTELLVLLTPYVLMTPDEVYAETSRLHDATQLRRTGWERGWSDSKLAREPDVNRLKKKAAKKIPQPHKKKDKKRNTESAKAEPKVSAELVFAEDLIEPAPDAESMTPEVIMEISEEPSPDDLVPMYADDQGDEVEVFVLSDPDQNEGDSGEPEPVADVQESDVAPEVISAEEVEQLEAQVEGAEESPESSSEDPNAPVIRSLQDRRQSGPPAIPSFPGR